MTLVFGIEACRAHTAITTSPTRNARLTHSGVLPGLYGLSPRPVRRSRPHGFSPLGEKTTDSWLKKPPLESHCEALTLN